MCPDYVPFKTYSVLASELLCSRDIDSIYDIPPCKNIAQGHFMVGVMHESRPRSKKS